MTVQLKVAVTRWAKQDALSELVAGAFEALGCQVTTFLPSAGIPNKIDLILIFGPFGSLVPITKQLLEVPPAHRPKLGLWMTEGLPRPDFPEWLRALLSRNRAWVERISYRQDQENLEQRHADANVRLNASAHSCCPSCHNKPAIDSFPERWIRRPAFPPGDPDRMK